MDTLDSRLAANARAKLDAALGYLGNWLTTHPESRFKPRQEFLLDEWLRLRKSGQDFLVDDWLRLRRSPRLEAQMPASETNRADNHTFPRFLLRESQRMTYGRWLRSAQLPVGSTGRGRDVRPLSARHRPASLKDGWFVSEKSLEAEVGIEPA